MLSALQYAGIPSAFRLEKFAFYNSEVCKIFLKMFFWQYEAKTQRMLTHLRVFQQSNVKKEFKKTSLDTACNGSTIKKTLIISSFSNRISIRYLY